MVTSKANEHLALAKDLLKKGAVDRAEEAYRNAIEELNPVSNDAFISHMLISGNAFPVSYKLGKEALQAARQVAADLDGPLSVEYCEKLVHLTMLPRMMNYVEITETLLDEFMVVAKANKNSPKMKEKEKAGLYAIYSFLADVKYQLNKMREACDLYKQAHRLVLSDLHVEATERIRVSLHYAYCLRNLKRETEADLIIEELERFLLWSNIELAERQ